MDQAILTWREGRAGRIRLNRPKSLHALDLEMIHKLRGALDEFNDDNGVELVVLDAPERGFCAGGNVRLARDAALAGNRAGVMEFFTAEYALNQAIADFPKPYVSLVDGVCMGGGVGISIHGSHCIASEAAMFAMPETAIALFPDVGASHFLPRMPGALGFYLGLTGARMAGADGVHAGFATHFVPRPQFPALTEALVQDGPAKIASFAAPLPKCILTPRRKLLDAAFSHTSWPKIIDSLEASMSPFAATILGQIRAASPLALHWTLRLLHHSRGRTLAQCLATELALVEKVAFHPEFLEGVRAVLVDKDKMPKWHPDRLEDVDPAVIDEMFEGVP
jgi:enoyl-CoA hydratase/carnithine racemase